ncbi:MAG: hypothetical protein M3Y72_05485 [Acidobacteriota bacterium]|nr:hypothetical protein [Acidobacteriota bacterium]
MATGLLLLPVTAKLDRAATAKSIPARTPASVKPDARIARLRRFFSTLHCPVLSMAEDFVQAADNNHLDWRLLPSISVIESGGGKAYRNNNIFGWNQGLQPFPSIRAGLDLVAYRLGNSSLYRNRDLVGKLHLYNPDQSYAAKVIDVMNRISPVADLSLAARSIRHQSEYAYVTN